VGTAYSVDHGAGEAIAIADSKGDISKPMGKKNHKKAIRSLNQRIAEHRDKIRIECEKDFPDEGLIRHGESEIRAFEKGIEQARKRLRS
jgi:hypothetical protein